MNNAHTSKYEPLWQWIIKNGTESFILSFSDIESITGFKLDHSFLNYKKELSDYGFIVRKISVKEKKVFFEKIN